MHSRFLNVGLWIALVLCLVVYHLLNVYVQLQPSDFFAIFKIIKFASLGGIVLAFMNSEIIAKIFLRRNFLGGKYHGTSTSINEPPSKPAPQQNGETDEYRHDDTIIVRQTLLKTTLSGLSCQKGTGELVSTWNGVLFKDEGCTYWFAVELHTKHGQHGILKINSEGDTLQGFYWSADPDHRAVASLKAMRCQR